MSAIRRTLLGTGSWTLTLVGALVIGFAVPAAWILVGSRLEGGPVGGPMIVFIGTGILVSCWLLLVIASWARTRLFGETEPTVRRAAWNRSVHERSRTEDALDPLERLFVIAAVIAMVAYAVWFAFFAGRLDPLPGSGFG
jgi:hypothetical protein